MLSLREISYIFLNVNSATYEMLEFIQCCVLQQQQKTIKLCKKQPQSVEPSEQ